MQTGFVGLGAMGAHMARNLCKAGLLTGVWNRSTDKSEALAKELGCIAFANLGELAGNCEAVVICVSADEDVRAVVAGLEAGLNPNMIVMDCSTIGAGTAREMSAQLDSLGVGFLDCPVSGGVEGARLGTLAIMVGGDESVYERALPILSAMGKNVAYLGPSGAGQAAKATNQIMCAGIIQAVGEAMAFAHAEGLPLDRLIELLGKGAGSSWYFVNRAPFMARNNFPAGFRVRLHEKDLKICHEMAARHGAALPVVESTLSEYAKLIAAGYGDEDISAIYRLKSQLFPDDAKPRGS
ncbi:MAG TPA: NAD(P)-dependent oxidoreductase [Steroidobacteraceae bacterium]|jgi:3-hydroxyisobutyrate dehydrogenase|nr:NAD(P)-dependent oxidoreductase [Steroidobacteraceae bacterium]